jgi:tRNA threonylcarbamoyladenosine biosynthesis protein TsaB
MLLSIDTATRWLGLALHDGYTLTAELGWQSVNRQTVELAPAVAGIFERANITAHDLTAIGVAIGPGSYTGLRVGLGFAKGMALAQQIPLIGISTLDTVAKGVGRMPGQLVVVVEAGRTRVCAGIYQYQNRKGWLPTTEPDIYSWDALLAQLKGKTNFAGEVSDEARKLIRKQAQGWKVLDAGIRTRRAGNLAQLAYNRFKKDDIDDAAALSPIYLRDPAGKKT